MKRRGLLKMASLLAATAPLSACEEIYSKLARDWGQKIPDKISGFQNKEIDSNFHLLSRAGYGVWPGDLEYVRKIGREAWLEEQLKPEKIDDKACDLRARRFETIHMDPGACYEFKKPVLRRDIIRHTLLRAVYSKRQLLESMVSFWTDHININIDKGDCIYLKPSDDRLVIRKHALGNFSDLISASAISPAMLVYLDGKDNRKSGPHDVPNENYARELLELHTLGVHGGYSQKDVFELARCLTGWRLKGEWQRGVVYFDPAFHDDGEKHLLGKRIPAGGGENDLKSAIKIVTAHPSCSQYIAHKLVRKFVADAPPASLVEKCAEAFRNSNGEIKPVLRVLFNSPEFEQSKGSKIKRPFHFIASSLRAIGADTHAHDDLIEYLQRMGQAPFQYPTPDGFPEEPGPWLGSLLWRWKFALALARGQIASVHVDLPKLTSALGLKEDKPDDLPTLLSYFFGRAADQSELAALEKFGETGSAGSPEHKAELLGLVIASPAFQRF